VWSNYEAVFHFHSASTTDSTGNSHTASISGAASTTGKSKLGPNSLLFNGSSDYASIPTIDFSGTHTVQALINADTWTNNNQEVVWAVGTGGNYEKLATYFRVDNDLEYALYDGSSIQWSFSPAGSRPSTGTWSWNQTSAATNDVEYCQDGSSIATDTSATLKDFGDTTVYIGRGSVANYYFDGAIDELRFTTTQTSENWAATEYNNQNSPSTFYSVTAEGGGGTSTNMQINIGDDWKTVDAIKINIGDSWKDVASIKQNIGDSWKTVF
jgi:hypothetical protein